MKNQNAVELGKLGISKNTEAQAEASRENGKKGRKKMKKRITKKLFCSIYSDMAKMRRKDPIQFGVLFNEWKRLREQYNIS